MTTTSLQPLTCLRRSETASLGLGARAASKIKMSAENLLAADMVWARVSACPTTRTSSSRANILRNPARKMACESARITRKGCALPSPPCGCSTFSGTPTGMLAISYLPPLTAVKTIFVDDHAHPVPAIFVKVHHHAPPAIELHIRVCAHHFGRQ